MKTYSIDTYFREPGAFAGVVHSFALKADGIVNLRKRLIAEYKDVALSYVVFEIPSSKSLRTYLEYHSDKGYKGTYNIKTIDGKKVPTWNVDQGTGWTYARNVINKDGTLGRKL